MLSGAEVMQPENRCELRLHMRTCVRGTVHTQSSAMVVCEGQGKEQVRLTLGNRACVDTHLFPRKASAGWEFRLDNLGCLVLSCTGSACFKCISHGSPFKPRECKFLGMGL